MRELGKNHDIWTQVLFSSLPGRVQFGLGSCAFLLLGSGSFLGKTWVLVLFVLAGLGFLFLDSYSHGLSLPFMMSFSCV